MAFRDMDRGGLWGSGPGAGPPPSDEIPRFVGENRVAGWANSPPAAQSREMTIARLVGSGREPRRSPERWWRAAQRPRWAPPLLFLSVASVLLASCGSSASRAGAVSPSSPAPAATQQAEAAATPSGTPRGSAPTATASPTPPSPKQEVELAVRVYLEPNDYAHRNYCAEGAIAVLLSTWTGAVPSLEAIGVAAHVVESYGTTGANAVVAINSYLGQITGTQRYAYTGTHVTSLAVFQQQLETDLSGLGRFVGAGHGSPVLVHVMTATLPGWEGYQAQHMIAVIGYNFSAGTAGADTVTYAESAGSVAGYNGPEVQTISLAALWNAMQNYNQDVSSDPVTVIS